LGRDEEIKFCARERSCGPSVVQQVGKGKGTREDPTEEIRAGGSVGPRAIHESLGPKQGEKQRRKNQKRLKSVTRKKTSPRSTTPASDH